jgi:CheY-like chemotaxis protein
LTGNAVKFTAEGGVRMHIKLLASGEAGHELQFTVADTGIGIPLHLQDSLFRPFTQADASTTRRYGGTGLGLTICRRLVAMFEGTIWFASEPGVGSEFHFTCRFGVAEPRPAAQRGNDTPALTAEAVSRLLQPRVLTMDKIQTDTAPVSVATPLHILLAEDNAVNQLVMKRLLHKRGHTVTVVSDGRSAAEAVACDDFDIVFMDVQMPELDGLQATQQIRGTEAAHQRVRIIALTAHALQGDKQRCLDAGMDDYLTKPVNPDELDRILSVHAAIRLDAA